MSNNVLISGDLPDEIWKEALQYYQQTTGQKLEPIPNARTIADLELMIESEIESAAVSRAKHAKLIKILQGILVPVQLTTNIVAGSDNTLGPGAFVFSAVRLLIRAVKDVTIRLDGIEDLLDKIQHFTARLSIYTSQRVSTQLRKVLIEVLAALIEVFAFCTKAIKFGRLRTFGRNALLGEDRRLRDTISKLDRLTSVEGQLVGAETYMLVNRQKQTIEQIATATTDILNEVKQQGANAHANVWSDQKNSTSEDKVYKLLLPTSNPQDIFDRIAKERLAGTGEWLLDDNTFHSWLQRSVPILWISGVSGAGKSFLSQFLASYLIEEQQAPGVSVAYFFFKNDDTETRSLRHALNDLAYQISTNDPTYAKYLMLVESRDIRTIESAWRRLFMNFFKSTKSYVYLVLDGVDEANEHDRYQLFSLLRHLTGVSEPVSISVILTGRPHLSDQIYETLEAPWITIDTKNSKDIATFTKHSIGKSRLLRRTSKELQMEILDTLVSEANGMFFWVDLMLKDLKTKPNGPAIQSALYRAPRGLDEMLSHVFKALMDSLPDDVEQLKEICTWATFGIRNLTLEELDGVLQYVSSSLLLLERKLRKDWASFLTLLREDGRSTEELEGLFEGAEDEFDSKPHDTYVTFRHSSIGDFFTHTLGEEAPAHVLRTTLRILCDENAQIPIRGYAQQNWLEHLRSVKVSSANASLKADIGSSLLQICRNRDTIELWSSGTNSSFWEQVNIDAFRNWLWDPELLTTLPPEDSSWIKSLVRPIDLFDEKASLIAHKWLQDKVWAPEACFKTLSVFLSLKGELDDGLDVETQIRKSAAWAAFETDALWHRRLGITFRKYNCLDAAKEQFEVAIQINPTMTLAYAGLALVHQDRGELEEALEFWQTVIKNMDLDTDYATDINFPVEILQRRQHATYFKWLGDAYTSLGREEEAFGAMQKSWEKDATFHEGLETAFEYLSRHNQSTKIMDILLELHTRSQLRNWLLSLTIGSVALRICRWAARTQNKMDFWVDVVRDTLSYCQRGKFPVGVIFTELILADTLYYERIDMGHAVRIWQRIEHVGSPKPETNMWLLKLFALTRLAESYFLSGDVEQLQRVANHKAFVEKAWFLLGRWHESHNRHQHALPYFTHLVVRAKNMADEKDHRAYLYASYILLYLNRKQEAVAVMRKSLARTEIDESPIQSERVWYCDGDCSPRKGYSRKDPVWVCPECFDTGLCTECAKRQKDGTLKVNICSPDHELFKVELLDDVVPNDMISIDGELVDFDAWADQQREQLGLQ